MSIQEQNTTRLSNQNTLHNSPKKAPDSTPQHDAKMRRRLFAARAGFFTGGFTVASWAPIIPFVQTELSLEPAVLGTLLFGLGIGSFFGMPIAGTVSTRFGNRAALAASGVLSCLLLVVLAMIPGFRIECAALLLYGVTLGCLEVSANIYGAQLEKEAGHPLMSGLHAAYSVGEVVSAGAITGLLVLGVPLLWVVGGLMVVLAAVLLWALSGVSPAEGRSAAKSEGMVFAPARGRILMLSLVCMSVFLAEGAMLDWSAIYVHQVGGVDLKAASRFEEWLEDAGADANLAGDESLSEALDKFAASLHPDCRFVPAEEALPEDAGEKPAFTLEASPVILIQPRPSGVRSAIRSIRKDIAEHRDVPAHLMEIVCPDVFPTLASGLTPTLSLEAKLAATAGEDPDVLLAKPANPEQLAIAHEVEHNNVVLVQGPPGTGKTHTIANLLGHFLSQGKRVLVTSHTTKALSVVKDLLPKEIQPLCVTMLGDRKDLEQTSSELITRLTRLNVEDLEARIRALGLERHRLGTALADRRRRIFEQRRIEHEAVEFNGRRYTLTEIAKFLREAERLQALFAEAPERNETYLRVMEFCRIPRTFDEVSTLLKDAAPAKSRNPYTDLPLYPSAYLGHLEGAGGLLWDEGWILTEDGAAFLEAHGCC